MVIQQTVSHYRVIKKLGVGGMGEVYLAQDTRLGRTVALKILPTDVAQDRERVRRFTQEARAASSLTHPNVAHIYEIGEADATHFIAMEFVEGQSLDARIHGQPLDVSEITLIGAEIADALDAAHAKSITHRDIKPSNIMLTPRRQVKVLDFGLAKVARPAEQVLVASDVSTQVKTGHGVVMGTMLYMSPEQALGRETDHRTDIFSLGVVLYEMATGRRPFFGATASEIIDHIIHTQPEAIARFNYSVPAELERIIRKCLEKERERRYQSARELQLDLENLKREVNAGGSTAPPVRRRGSRQVINSLAVLPLANASAEPNADYLSDGITESIINNLSQLPKLRVMARSAVFRYKGREVNPQEIGLELGVRAVLTGRVLHLGGRFVIGVELVNVADGSQLWGEHYNRQLSDIFEAQEEIAREISDKLRLRLSSEQRKLLAKRYTDDTEAYKLYLKGTYYSGKWTEEGLKKGIEHFKQAIDRDPNYALAYAGMANSYVKLGLFSITPQRDAYPKAKAAALKALKIDTTLAEAHASLGFVKQLYDWDWSGAKSELQRAIEINPNYAEAHFIYCYHFVHMGQFDEAFTEIKRAQELDPLSVEYMAGAADVYKDARQYDQAIELCRKALDMDRNYGEAYLFLGQAYEYKGMYEEALAEYEKAIGLVGNTPEIAASLGHAYAVSGKRDEAQKVIKDLKELSNRRYVDPTYVAVIHAALGENDQAFHWLEKAYDDRSGVLVHAKVEPIFDDLRADPRFTDLLQRVGLAP